MRRHARMFIRFRTAITLVGLLWPASAALGCTTASRAVPIAAARSGCPGDKIEIVRQDGHDAVLNVCGVNEDWSWSMINGYEYVGPSAVQPVRQPADSDHDGVPDEVDACPVLAGVAGADARSNGCPPPADRDADGIPDLQDACPAVAGVPQPDVHRHGCPLDSDGDGIADHDDACLGTAGVAHADPKQNGCPPDGDGDGVPDAADGCPTEPGDGDRSGCPTHNDESTPDEPPEPASEPSPSNGEPRAE